MTKKNSTYQTHFIRDMVAIVLVKKGLATWKRSFPFFNDSVKVRKSLSYLVRGKGDIVERIGNVIHAHDYNLNEFGLANVQELIMVQQRRASDN